MKKLETERLILRERESGDISQLFKGVFQDPGARYFLNWPFCGNEQETERFLNARFGKEKEQESNLLFWVLEEKESHRVAGCVAVCRMEKQWIAELEFAVCRNFRGNGYLPEALRRICGYLLREWDCFRVEAVCNVENEASAKAMEKSGMKLEGILRGSAVNRKADGSHGDLKLYAIIMADLES